MNRICQSIKVEMNADLSLRGCKINKITPKSLKWSKNSKIWSYSPSHQGGIPYSILGNIKTQWVKDNNITKAFFGSGQFGGVTLHGPRMGGTPSPGPADRVAVWLFTRPFGPFLDDRAPIALWPGRGLKNRTCVIYAAKYLLCVILLLFSLCFRAFTKKFFVGVPGYDLF